MEKEKLFIYQLFSSLYRNGCKKIDVSNESLKKLLPYIKCSLDKSELENIKSLFTIDKDGVYANYLKTISELDPLLATRENNDVYLVMNDEMCNLFNDDNVNYLGAKVAAYIKIKEKVKVYYENN